MKPLLSCRKALMHDRGKRHFHQNRKWAFRNRYRSGFEGDVPDLCCLAAEVALIRDLMCKLDLFHDGIALIHVIAVKPVLIGVDAGVSPTDSVCVAVAGKLACGDLRYRLQVFRQSVAARRRRGRALSATGMVVLSRSPAGAFIRCGNGSGERRIECLQSVMASGHSRHSAYFPTGITGGQKWRNTL